MSRSAHRAAQSYHVSETRACPFGCKGRGHSAGCGSDRCEGCLPQLAAQGQQLCYRCGDRLAHNLRQLPQLYTELLAAHQPYRSGPGGDVVTGSAEKRIPIRGPISDARSDIAGRLASWCGTVAQARHLHGPTTRAPQVTALWLAGWLDFSLRQEWAYEYAAEMRETVRQAWRLAHPSGWRRVPLPNPCAAVTWCDVETASEHACGGVLTAHVDPDTGDYAGVSDSRITCRTCERVVPRDQWLSLGRSFQKGAA